MPKRLNLGSKFLKDDLLAMTHVDGEFYYATDTNELFFCDDGELKLINANYEGGGGDAEGPFYMDLSELERYGDLFHLDISRLNGKHLIITNNFPLEPETPGNKFQFKLISGPDGFPALNPIELNLYAQKINGEAGFNFTTGLTTSFINYKEYRNGTEEKTPLTDYTETPHGLLNIKVMGSLFLITHVVNEVGAN